MKTIPVIMLGCALCACKPAAEADKKAEARLEMKRLEAHREKSVEKATQGTVPEPKSSTFDPTAPVKPRAVINPGKEP